ncbi:MAG TPA: response regulator transcription factor [Ktedonobacterales bacterium]|nr:response regulator transcription factor [Ktedonobacterales bacterium]
MRGEDVLLCGGRTVEQQGKSLSGQTILVVDDEQSIIDFIKLGMKYEGARVETAMDGYVALDASRRLRPNLIILDIMLPGIDGLEVCRRLRAQELTADIPVLMLTAKDDVSDRVAGLNTGADDYLTKPFSFEELLARVKAILRRQQRVGANDAATPGTRILRVADLELNEATREVARGGRLLEPLTATEYNLLHLFMTHPRQVLDRQTILSRVWGYDFMGETNIIEVYVRYLREKIEDEPSQPRYILTVRGVGYVLKA